MHSGIITCDPETPVREVAALMSTHRVHAIAVSGIADRPAAVVSDLDVMAAVACNGDNLEVRQVAVTEALIVTRDRSVRDAAQLMAEHGVSHAIVVDENNGDPVGVLSTTDVLAACTRNGDSGSELSANQVRSGH